jgi:hypothetical protein
MLTAEQYRAQLAAAMTEAELQERVIRAARITGWRYYHPPDNRPGGKSGRVQRVVPGFPDLVLVHVAQRRIMYRELKTQTGRVSPDQRTWLDDLAIAGADVGVWRPADLLEERILVELTRRVHRP